MTQKITLSIPDRLHEKLNEWRSSFNLSKMFQDALSDAIERKEAFSKKLCEEFDMTQIINRLHQEKEQWLKNFYNAGRNRGFGWAQGAHYQDLLYVLACNDTCNSEQEIVRHSRFKAYFADLYDAHGLTRYAQKSGVDHEKKFLQGWFDGVNAFWNEVREHI
ncbi:hypothetical protein [Desulfobacter hydrogenophilus]|nr:hypothetical protein [Desulfobacter hydrogenophilus]NDY71648.1 hypothetical protein [Desulfobacter hydrogenophilus]QBH15425.1 hypothetical protein EYB58_22475 [Desulfobacter hydrogenophilus]